MERRFLFNRRLELLVVFILIVIGCSRVPQKELQPAVDPLNSQNYSLAIQKLSHLLEKYPDNAQINYYLAFAYVKNDDYARKALDRIDKVLAIDKRYSAVVGDTSMANFLAGNSDNTNDPYFRLAVKEVDKIISMHPGTEISDRIQLHKAHFYILKQSYEKALRELEKVIASPPNDTESDIQSRLMIGNIYLENLEDEKKGMEAYQYLIDHYPGKPATAEAVFLLAEFNREKMKTYKKRSRSLQEFIDKWKDNKSLGENIPAAREQIEKDLKVAEEHKSKAVAGYQKIIAEYRNSAFYSRAESRLSKP